MSDEPRFAEHDRRKLAAGLLLAAVALLAITCSGDDSESAPHIVLGESGSEFRGALLTREIAMPDAMLSTTDGSAFDLRAETTDAVTLLYVGYTHCPDICPTHMAEISTAMDDLPAETRERVKVIFVTSDPGRDTPEVVQEWLAKFDSSFIGLTGTSEQIRRFQDDLGMNVASKEHGEHGDYEVNHASYVLAFEDGRKPAKLAYPSGMSAEDYRHDLLKLAGTK